MPVFKKSFRRNALNDRLVFLGITVCKLLEKMTRQQKDEV